MNAPRKQYYTLAASYGFALVLTAYCNTATAISFLSFDARSMAMGGAGNVGINLKEIKTETIEFSQLIDEVDFDAYRLHIHRKTHKHFNMDIGLIYALSNRYSLGAVIRNIIPYKVATVSGRNLPMDPIARAGIGYQSESFKLALDLDLTNNQPLGFDPNKRYVSLGAEWSIWQATALRAGYRVNVADGEELPSLGFGLGFNQAHIDVALAHSSAQDEWGLSLQAGFRF